MKDLRKAASTSRLLVAALAVALTAVALTVTSALGAESGSSTASGDQAAVPAPPQGPPPVIGLAAGDRKAFEAFRDCMSDHGVDVPEPPAGPPPAEPTDQERQAFEACSDKLPRPPHGCPPPSGSPPAADAMRRGHR